MLKYDDVCSVLKFVCQPVHCKNSLGLHPGYLHVKFGEDMHELRKANELQSSAYMGFSVGRQISRANNPLFL